MRRPMAKSPYPFTANDAANALLARDGTALLIGLCLDQQVRTEKAMIGPYDLHRYPGMMAKRVRALCAALADKYGGNGARVWERATNAAEVYERLLELPGFGKDKAGAGVRILAKFGGLKLPGWRNYSCEADMPWVIKDGKRS